MEYTLGSIMNAIGITDLKCTRAANIGDITLEDYFEIVGFKCRLVRSTALRISDGRHPSSWGLADISH